MASGSTGRHGRLGRRPAVTDLPRSTCSGRTSGCAAYSVRAYLADLLARVWDGSSNQGRVFDLTLPLEQVAEAYAAMDERRSIKTLLRP